MMVLLLKCAAFLLVLGSVRSSPWYDDALSDGRRTLVQCRRDTSAFERADEDLSDSVVRMKDCLRSAFLNSLDDLVHSPEIPISDYVSLVGSNNISDKSIGRSSPDDDLLTAVTNKMYAVLDTHSIKLNFSPFEDAVPGAQVEGRQRRIRRRFRRAFPMVVAGFFIMAAILIPPGFQFMAIITGKALLIAKIAFAMAVGSHYRSVMADLNFHHHSLLHQPQQHSHQLALRPGELPGGIGLPGLLGAGGATSGITQAFALQQSPFGLGNSILPLRRNS